MLFYSYRLGHKLLLPLMSVSCELIWGDVQQREPAAAFERWCLVRSFNLSPVSPALPCPWWTSWAPVRARRCILPTGKSRQVARSARFRSRKVYFGRGRRTSRAIGCSPPSSCSGSLAWSPLYARQPPERARGPRCSGRFSAFCRTVRKREKSGTATAFTASPCSPRMPVKFPEERRAAQRRRGAGKSCLAVGSASAGELIVETSESHKQE